MIVFLRCIVLLCFSCLQANAEQPLNKMELESRYPVFSEILAELEATYGVSSEFQIRPPLAGAVGSIVSLERQLDSIRSSNEMCRALNGTKAYLTNHLSGSERLYFRIIASDELPCALHTLPGRNEAFSGEFHLDRHESNVLNAHSLFYRYYTDAEQKLVSIKGYEKLSPYSPRWLFYRIFLGGGDRVDGNLPLFYYNFPLRLGTELK